MCMTVDDRVGTPEENEIARKEIRQLTEAVIYVLDINEDAKALIREYNSDPAQHGSWKKFLKSKGLEELPLVKGSDAYDIEGEILSFDVSRIPEGEDITMRFEGAFRERVKALDTMEQASLAMTSIALLRLRGIIFRDKGYDILNVGPSFDEPSGWTPEGDGWTPPGF